ncbi:MAG TPA: ATP-binding cassette domain-containing protein, partial [Casimicrobiaceae bacterium]
MLKVEHLQVAYGTVQTLWDVSFEVPRGEIVALVGANGAGKTTTLRTLSALLRPLAGSIMLDDEPLAGCSSEQVVQRGIVQVPEGRQLFPEMTVLDNLLMGAYSTRTPGRRERLDKVFSIFPLLKERSNQMAGTLSGGEQQMAAIGRGLMAEPRLLML